MIRELLDTLPLWSLFLLTVLVVATFNEVGYRIGMARSHRNDTDDESHVSATTGGLLALMGFLLAFTFSQAADHHTVRKRLVLEEIVVIDAAYMRADLVPEKRGNAIQQGLRDYVELTANARERGGPAVVLAEAQAIRERVWDEVVALMSEVEVGELEALLVDSINRVFEVHEQRVAAAFRARIPPSIWTMLYVVLMLSMFGMGYFSGMKGKRSMVTTNVMIVSLAMIMWLIADLDRPQAGLVKADTSSLKEFHLRLE